jgi:hypothetical protein
VSRRSQAKRARRNKRRATRDSRWLPETVLGELSDDIDLAAALESFDARITERGWTFDEDLSDYESALWTYAPSAAEVADEDIASVTTIVLTADDGTEAAHVVFVGTADDYEFELDELFDSLDVIEAYRVGDAVPEFSS